MYRNKWFMGIQFIITGGQVLIIFVGGAAFSVQRLTGPLWGVSLVLGVLSLPIAVVIRLIPDELIRKIIPARLWVRKKGPQVFVSDEDRRYEWNPALEEIKDQLTFIKTVRGGRLSLLKHKLHHPQELLPRSRSSSRSRDDSAPPTPMEDNNERGQSPAPPSPTPSPQPPATPESRSRRTRSRSNSAFGPAAAMAGVVAGSIAGWSPIERPDEGDAIPFQPNKPHGGLDEHQGIEIHPQTADGDNVVTEYDASSKSPPSQNPELVPYFENAPPPERASSSRRRSRSSQSQSQA